MAQHKPAVTPLLTLELLQSCTKPSIYYEPVLLQYGLTQPTVAYHTPLAEVVQRSNFEKTADIGELLAVGERWPYCSKTQKYHYDQLKCTTYHHHLNPLSMFSFLHVNSSVQQWSIISTQLQPPPFSSAARCQKTDFLLKGGNILSVCLLSSALLWVVSLRQVAVFY